jgi:NAD(P)-dependent dehydrogenase (short-subunit alcohol dehydrogenase family)
MSTTIERDDPAVRNHPVADPKRVGLDTGRLRGSVALVTGAGRGVGQLVATTFAAAGAAVAMVARSADELAHTVELISTTGGAAAAAVADVTDAAGLTAAVADLRYQLGPVDLLVNNAGILGPAGPLWELPLEQWWTTMDVNVRGLVLATQLVLPDMVAAGRGRIINITSQAGVHRWPLASAYSVSKAAVVKLTENLALETRRHGVGVFSVHPGLLPIGISETIAAHTPTSTHEAHIRAWALNALAEGRGADPAQAADLLLRIAAGDADRLSGRHLSVHDDLDGVLARLPEVLERDLYVLRPDGLRNIDD